jgi:hypothetical protein
VIRRGLSLTAFGFFLFGVDKRFEISNLDLLMCIADIIRLENILFIGSIRIF